MIVQNKLIKLYFASGDYHYDVSLLSLLVLLLNIVNTNAPPT